MDDNADGYIEVACLYFKAEKSNVWLGTNLPNLFNIELDQHKFEGAIKLSFIKGQENGIGI